MYRVSPSPFEGGPQQGRSQHCWGRGRAASGRLSGRPRPAARAIFRSSSKILQRVVGAAEFQEDVAELFKRDGEVALLLCVSRVGLGQRASDLQAVLVALQRLVGAAERPEDVAELVERDGEVALLLGVSRVGLGQRERSSGRPRSSSAPRRGGRAPGRRRRAC